MKLIAKILLGVAIMPLGACQDQRETEAQARLKFAQLCDAARYSTGKLDNKLKWYSDPYLSSFQTACTMEMTWEMPDGTLKRCDWLIGGGAPSCGYNLPTVPE